MEKTTKTNFTVAYFVVLAAKYIGFGIMILIPIWMLRDTIKYNIKYRRIK